MNTANLQLEGVLMAMAALCRLMQEKGIAGEQEIENALRLSEEMLASDKLRPEQLSQSNVDATLFPLRFLREANRRNAAGDNYAYAQIATAVGRALPSRNDV
jgi:hypothetical protein